MNIDSELVTAVIAALFGGGATSLGVSRLTRRGSPEDHEQRIARLETRDAECSDRHEKTEARMLTTENALATALGRLSESTDRQWKALDRLTDSVDELKGVVARLDVEATVEREMRKHARKENDR